MRQELKDTKKNERKGKERGIGKVREEVYTATDDFVTEKKRRENQVGKTA